MDSKSIAWACFEVFRVSCCITYKISTDLCLILSLHVVSLDSVHCWSESGRGSDSDEAEAIRAFFFCCVM